jgi:UDP-N-acetylglucosamine 4,6-dehydratase/5-epimerase
MKTVLITGATGFLGKKITQSFLERGYKVIGTGHSEEKIKKFERSFGNIVPIYQIDISSDYYRIKNIIKEHSVNYIIHSAALKHVGICENNPSRAVDVNIVGSQNIIKAAIECDVENVIGISTDKAVNPSCTYGITKKIMEEMLLEHNFGIFQGVNFLFSTGSVLDIWDDLRNSNKPILVNKNAKRFFSSLEQVCNKIIESLDVRGIFSIDECYEISISDLQKAYAKYHNFFKHGEYIPLSVEKQEEDLSLKNIKINNLKTDEIVCLFENYYQKEDLIIE